MNHFFLEKNAIFQKDWVKNNTAFTNDQIEDFYELFKLLADPKNNKIFVDEILQTAKTLGIDSKYGLVYKVLEKFQNETGDQGVDFETFVKELTKRVVRFNFFLLFHFYSHFLTILIICH